MQAEKTTRYKIKNIFKTVLVLEITSKNTTPTTPISLPSSCDSFQLFDNTNLDVSQFRKRKRNDVEQSKKFMNSHEFSFSATCSQCGMSYMKGKDDDEKIHEKHCRDSKIITFKVSHFQYKYLHGGSDPFRCSKVQLLLNNMKMDRLW